MVLNRENSCRWEGDSAQSILEYNRWFLSKAPEIHRRCLDTARLNISQAFEITDNLLKFDRNCLYKHPLLVQTLRLCTLPPLGKDRLVGLTSIKKGFIHAMEKSPDLFTPIKTRNRNLHADLDTIVNTIYLLLDPIIFPWVKESREPTSGELDTAKTILSYRMADTYSDHEIRIMQEKRQIKCVEFLLYQHGYVRNDDITDYKKLPPGSFSTHIAIPVRLNEKESNEVKIPIDLAIQTKTINDHSNLILLEAKSAGDFTNVNKRRKEEVIKYQQLYQAYGNSLQYFLFLGGYFNTAYLKYIAAEGLDWIWEHRPEDLLKVLIS